MTAENFDNMLNQLIDLKPFQMFTVELNGGDRFEIDHPKAIIVRDGVAVSLTPGIPVWFDHDSVNKIIGASATTKL